MAVDVRKRIRSLRKAKGLSAAEVAKKVGISRPYYTQIEGGKRRLSVPHLEKIARALRVSVLELYREPAGRNKKAVNRHIRPINTPELRERLRPLLGEHTEDFVDCFQVWVRTPEKLRRELRVGGAQSR